MKLSEFYFVITSIFTLATSAFGATPDVPILLSPEDDRLDTAINLTLSWLENDVDDDIVSRQVRVGTVSGDLTDSYDPVESNLTLNGLDEATQYYWQVVVTDAVGNQTSGPEWSFSTEDYAVNISGLRGWYRPEQLSLEYAEGQFVGVWRDALGVYNLSVSNNNDKPVYRETLLNNYGGLDFDNENDRLYGSYDHLVSSDSLTISVVYAQKSLNGNMRAVNSQDISFLMGARSNAGNAYGIYASGWLSDVSPETFEAGRFIVHTYRYDAAGTGKMEHWIDGRLVGELTGTKLAHRRIGLGEIIYNEELNGYVSELLIYQKALSNEEIGQLGVYLADKYKLYHPNATWMDAYTTAQQAVIHSSGYTQSQADAVFAIQSESPAVTDAVVSGLKSWYRPEELAEDYAVENEDVGVWRDALGVRTLSVSTDSYKPHYREDLLNGYGGLNFDNKDDRLYGNYDHLSSDDSLTISVVYAQKSLNGNMRAVNSQDVNFLMGARSSTGTAYGVYASGWLSDVSPETFEAGRFIVHTYRYDAAGTGKMEHWIDGRLVGELTGTKLAHRRIGLGEIIYNEELNGYVSELLIYQKALSDEEVGQLGVYLADKYKLYHPNATWIDAYTTAQQAVIHLSGYTQSQADAVFAIQSESPAVTDAVVSGLKSWYRPEELAEDYAVENEDVGVWRDALGVRTLSVSTDSYKPHYREDLLNGYGGLNFDNKDDRLYGNYDHLSSDDSLTISVVYAQKSLNGNMRAVNSQDVNFLMGARSSTGNAYGVYASGWLSDTSSETFEAGRFIVHTYRYDAAGAGKMEHWIDGRLVGELTGTKLAHRRIGLGEIIYNEELNGYVSELLIYQKALSNEEIGQLGVYLADKYKLYHLNATWMDAYTTAQQAVIHSSGYTQSKADAVFAIQSESPAVTDAVVSGLKSWYRPEELAEDYAVENEDVGAWRDALGVRTLSVSTDSYKPHYREDLLNGYGGLDFDNKDDRLYGNYDHLSSDDSLTISVVYAQKSLNGNMRAVNSQDVSFLMGARSSAGNAYGVYASAWLADASPEAFEAGRFIVHTYRYDADGTGKMEHWIDGRLVGELTGTKLAHRRIGLGEIIYNEELNGYVSELLIYQKALSNEEISQLGVYLSNKYNLPYLGDIVYFLDAQLEAAVRELSEIPDTGDITKDDLAQLSGTLDFSNRGITNLYGLQYATGITGLNLSDNAIANLAPLAELTGLISLNLSHNQIHDPSPLASLTLLAALDLSHNRLDLDAGDPDRLFVDGFHIPVTTAGQERYTLQTVTTGPGTVTKSPDQTDYGYGDQVTLTANKADPNHLFNGWSGDASGNASPLNVVTNSDMLINGAFSVGVADGSGDGLVVDVYHFNPSDIPEFLDSFTGAGERTLFTEPEFYLDDNPVASGNDHFSCRFSGQLEAKYTANYTFIAKADNNVAVYLNGEAIIFNGDASVWNQEYSSVPIALVAGQQYDLIVLFREITGQESIYLDWQPEGGARQRIPRSQLYSGTSGTEFASSVSANYYAASGAPITVAGTSLQYGTGTLQQNSQVALMAAGDTIRYTFDGSEPTASSLLYTQPLLIAGKHHA